MVGHLATRLAYYRLANGRWYTFKSIYLSLRNRYQLTTELEGHMADSITPSVGETTASGQPPGAEPRLRMRGISKSFGAVRALSNVDFEVYAGEVVGLVGDNGAGKSTLIKTIAGVGPADEGEIFLEGQPVNITSPQVATGSCAFI